MPDSTTASDAGRYLTERAPEWLAAVARRHSRRAFDGQPVAAALLDSMDACCNTFRPYPDARTVLVRSPEVDIFKGIVGSYGKVTGASTCSSS